MTFLFQYLKSLKNLLLSLAIPSLLAWFILLGSCKKDELFTGNANLHFSADTILFDTVFTQLDTATHPKSINQQLIVRNPYNKTIRTTISLAGGPTSQFKINIDGQPSTYVPDYEIRAGDSIYIFVELYAIPNGGTGKLIIMDSIRFETNGDQQFVQLRAWGQDAHFYNDSILPCGMVWTDNTKPYVIYNSVLVPENCVLSIGPGVHIYSAPGSFIYVAGTIEINGNSASRVILEGDRLDPEYAEQPGQWGGIWLLRESKDNIITHTDIKNANIGIQVDSLPVTGNPNLRLISSTIQNMTSVGLLGRTATIEATNCLLANCGQLTFLGSYGGDYDLEHCTFAMYNNFLPRLNGTFGLTNVLRDGNVILRRFEMKYAVSNCIIYGTNEEELFFDLDESLVTSAAFNTNIIKTKNQALVPEPLRKKDPKFKDPYERDFTLILYPRQKMQVRLSE